MNSYAQRRGMKCPRDIAAVGAGSLFVWEELRLCVLMDNTACSSWFCVISFFCIVQDAEK
jgi:hypothetical protein